MSMNWQYAAPLHISSILVKRESSDWLTQASMSCRERLSVVTDVEYTFTAIPMPVVVCYGGMGDLKQDVFSVKCCKHRYMISILSIDCLQGIRDTDLLKRARIMTQSSS